MIEITAERLGQRIIDVGLLDTRQMEQVWAEIGSREIPVEQLTSFLLRKQLLTNLHVERLMKGERDGYFYGNFKVQYLSGSGTFARVYRGVEKGTDRIVAVKVLRRRFREDAKAIDHFLREGEMCAKLRHPNIVPIYEVGKAKDSPYFVMEFVEGQNLREFIKVRKKMTPKEAMSVAIDVLTGLAYAFEKGMQHRDMKMSNVLISKGRAKLVDFGLAAMSSAKDAEDATTRSIDYAALERASGVKNNDPRSDLYFVGAMIYHMLTGVQPLGESKERSQRLSVSRFQNIRPITTLEPNLPPAIVLFITRAMELDPERRFGSAQEMLDEAQRVLIKVEAYEKAVAAGAEAAEAAEVAAAEMPAEMEGLSRTVMIVESKMEIQDILRERLKKHGYRVLIFSDPARAIQRFLDSPQLPADCVMFCCPTLGDSALDAFNQFGTLNETKHVPAILFVDGKQRHLERSALVGAHRVVMAAPLKLKELRQSLLRLLNASMKTKPVA